MLRGRGAEPGAKRQPFTLADLTKSATGSGGERGAIDAIKLLWERGVITRAEAA